MLKVVVSSKIEAKPSAPGLTKEWNKEWNQLKLRRIACLFVVILVVCGRPHLRKLLLVTGTCKEEIGKNGATSFSWSSWNIFVSIKRYRNVHFTVKKPLGHEMRRGGILLQWLIFRKNKAASAQGWPGRPWMGLSLLGESRGRSCSALPPAPLCCCHPHFATSRSSLLLYPCHPPALPGSHTRWRQLKCYSNSQHLYKSLSKAPG